ncbi:MAG: hypothetical protein H7144_12345 [Burkholderiales bacterium]|nr:hypothetical protein [Phycisphaerae bacterium]
MTLPSKAHHHFLKMVLTTSLAVGAASPVLAQAPTSRPADRARQTGAWRDRAAGEVRPGDMRPGDMRPGEMRPGEMRPGRPEAPPARQDPPSDAEWEEVAKFAQENLPNRWKMYEEVVQAKRPNAIEAIKLRMANRYRALQRTRGDNPGVYRALLEQAKLEDDVWAAVRDLRANPGDTGMRESVREKIKALVRANLDERTRRIENMKAALEREEGRLIDDREHEEQLIDTQMEQMTTDRPMADRPMGDRPPRTGPRRPDAADAPRQTQDDPAPK